MKKWIVAGLIVLSFGIILSVIGSVLYLNDLESEPIYLEDVEFDVDEADERELSLKQEDYLEIYDYPSRFSLMIYKSDGQRIYNEQWYYDEEGMVLNFLNGELISESNMDPDDELVDTAYKPEDYVYGMSLGQALSVSGIDEFLYVPVEADFMEDAKAIYAENLMIGIKDDQVVFIETIGLD